MPELPEVETLKLGLQKYIVGKKIKDLTVNDSKLLTGDPKSIEEAKVLDVRRYAKGIVIDLSNKYSVAFHIKLTGQLIFRDDTNRELQIMKPTPATVPNKFTRVVINFKDGSNLYFQEVRGFAWMKILKTDDLKTLPFFKSLGPEPIPSPGSGTPKLTLEYFSSIVKKSNLPIKVLIMDQQKIGGIGNIYANDGCFDAHIDPRRKAKTLTDDEIKALFDSILKVLEKALEFRGSSELNFVDVLGQLGEYQKYFLVYGRKNKPCTRNDGGVVEKIYLGGRGTFYCTKCQK
ncbi:MAG TPA: bifunctional DNA-formamidopyrimidine glycosylase/DNA-(apurinic or apyrimidinic site) lyase [Patescibacteria group bacterium]|nr:bifunctional DNA-formamidopyrimidine glycosylase/DNA-(apurinic or apyrimidinic site) lyase [Patescibacteria group bacterium]